MARSLHAADFDEAVNEYGEIRCTDCQDAIDLSDAGTINEGVEIWNDHVREHHPEMV